MNKRYAMLLLISGVAWFLIAGVLGYAIPVLGSRWAQHLVCAIFTAFVVGTGFRFRILHWTGWRWYLLPVLTLLTGSTVFGLLLTCSWCLAEPGGLEREAFYMLPLNIVFYTMAFGWITYPLALLTQCLLRRGWTSGQDAEPDAPPNGGSAEPFRTSEAGGGPPSVT
jgi:hypothetical protein